MNTTLIGNLVRLRYKLMWAKTRSRNGRIALFFAGYLVFVLVVMLLVTGGFAAGMTAIRLGKTETVAQVVLTSLFMQGLVGSVVLGFGLNAIFSDTELRRYPVRESERFLARHIIGIVDPFWFFIFTLELGFALGLFVFGTISFPPALLAVLLLFVVNYLAARVVATLVDRMMARKSGTVILTMLIMLLAIGPSAAAPLVRKHPEFGHAALEILRGSPFFGAAALMANTPAALAGFGLLLLWVAALLLLLVMIERSPAAVRSTATRKVTWESPYEKVGAWFGPEHGPFVAHWLRFYLRNSRFRMLYLLTLPLTVFLTYNMSRGPRGSVFAAALGTFPVASFLATSRMAVNQYGYLGGAFRRLALLPTAPDASLRTGSYASVLLGSSMLPIAAILWIVLAPVPFDARMLAMLLASGVTGLLLFHAAALWVSLLNPRKGNYTSSFGNDLSLFGNILLLGGTLFCIVAPQGLARYAPAVISPKNWWLYPEAAVLAAAIYYYSLAAAGGVFRGRRERLLAIVEGRG
jgi:hypothetical protein